MPFLLANWKIFVVIGLIIGVFIAGNNYGADKTQAKWDKERLEQQKATIAAQNSVIAKERSDAAKTGKVSHDYQTHIAVIDGLYATASNSLQSTPDPASDRMSSIPSAQSGHNAATCHDRLSRKNKQVLYDLMKQADIQTARLVACQAFISEHAN